MGMPGEILVVVGAFGTAPEAELAKGALEAADIDSMIRADSVGGVEPNVAWASGGYKLLVREEEEAAALEVLQPIDGTPFDDEDRE